jgi:hypothetical protein
MPTTEQLTVEHYARAELERAILAGLHALGADAAPTPEHLAAVDEFHMGGPPATSPPPMAAGSQASTSRPTMSGRRAG